MYYSKKLATVLSVQCIFYYFFSFYSHKHYDNNLAFEYIFYLIIFLRLTMALLAFHFKREVKFPNAQ